MTDFLFADEQIDNIAKASNDESWNILVVDDEEDIHQVTKLVLSGFEFEDKALRFHHAYSAKEAMDLLLRCMDRFQSFLESFGLKPIATQNINLQADITQKQFVINYNIQNGDTIKPNSN
mgnify:CR=1 FL=1